MTLNSKKILFVTANFGTRDNFPIQKPFDTHDFIMFTDNVIKYEKSGWTVKHFNYNFHTTEKINNIHKNRYIKFQLHNIIDISQYTMIVYCDGYMFPKNNTSWLQYLEVIQNTGLIQALHKKRRNIYEECDAIHRARKDTMENMKKMKNYLRSLNVPKIQIYENTAFCYDKTILNLMDEFWSLYSSLNITYRDQPLWNYLLYKNNVVPYISNTLFSNFERVKHSGHKYV